MAGSRLRHRFHREALRELTEVTETYEAQDPTLAREFARAVADGVEKILQFPDAWQKVELGLRRYRTRKFPYGLVYQRTGDEIVIVAVMHLKRQPGYWARRV